MNIFRLPCIVCVLISTVFNMAATRNRKFVFENKPKLLLSRTLTFEKTLDFLLVTLNLLILDHRLLTPTLGPGQKPRLDGHLQQLRPFTDGPFDTTTNTNL